MSGWWRHHLGCLVAQGVIHRRQTGNSSCRKRLSAIASRSELDENTAMLQTPTLTAKQQRFVAEYLVDGNATQAAVRAGYGVAGARIAGYRALRNVAISKAIAGRQLADATRLSITRELALAGLLEAVAVAREQREPAAMIAGWKTIASMLGLMAPARVQVEARVGEYGFEWMSDAELLAVMAGGATTIS